MFQAEELRERRRRWSRGARAAGLLVFAAGLGLAAGQPGTTAAGQDAPEVLDAVVFAPAHGTLYAPLEATAAALDLPLGRTDRGRGVLLGKVRVSSRDLRSVPDATPVVRLRLLAELSELEVTVEWDAERQVAAARRGERELLLRRGRRTITDGVTFAAAPGVLYVPVPEFERALDVPAPSTGEGPDAPGGETDRVLGDGARLVAVRTLAQTAALSWTEGQGAARLARDERELWVRRGTKQVALNLKEQRMRAWEGERAVLDTPVSSGRNGMATPRGSFQAGPLKSPLVISRRYGNARMPWSVQVHGNIFIHGYPSVPPYPASHGCIRVPLTGRNPARWFYDWVSLGTPIHIADDWPPPDR